MSADHGIGPDRLGALSSDKRELLKLLREQKSRQAQMIKPRPRSPGVATLRWPASRSQHRLWFIDQLEGGSAGYSIPAALRLRGCLDRGVLQTALDAVVQRHEVLRTVFVEVQGIPMQEVSAHGRCVLSMVDLSGLSAEQIETQIQAQRFEEAHGKFDLARGPLIRGRLIKVAQEDHVLLITMHHIVADGWSTGVLISEIAQLYRAHLDADVDPLESMPIQYADYAHWQQGWLDGKALQTQLSYWLSCLEGATPQLELPTDRPRPAVQSYRGGNFNFVLDAHLSASLKALAQQREMTLFMILYAGWAALLSRLSGQEDVLVGTPVANRQRPELEGLIGFFVNTVVLRVPVRGDERVVELLQRVKDATLSAYDHQDVPFEKVVEALQPQRSLSRNPLFQVMFALQNAPRSHFTAPGLDVTLMEGVDEPAIFDLFVSVEERGEEIVGLVNYAADLFDRTTMERWMACWIELLGGMAANPRRRVGEIPLLPEREHHQVVERFNATRTDYPDKTLVHQLFEAQAAQTPQIAAVSCAGQSLTYAQLETKANQLARYLLNKGVGPDHVVGICVERSLEMVIGLLGILKAGAAYLPLDPSYPTERLQYMLEDAAPAVVLIQDRLRATLPATRAQLIGLDSTLEEIATRIGRDPLPAQELAPQNLVYVIYTSGSTGRPKATAMGHGSMVNLLEWHRRHLPLAEGSRVLQFAALSFDVAFQDIFSTLCMGGTLVLLDEWVRRDAAALTTFLQAESIHRLFVPPLMLQAVAEEAGRSGMALTELRDVITAGEQLRISPEIRKLFVRLDRCRLHNHYGPTETHVVTALTLAGTPSEWPTLPSIGQPIANILMYVLDAYRRPAPLGVAGEIYIGGVGVARGYRKRPELTAERFVRDPLSADPRARMYKTGDLGRWRADGSLEYLGRNDDQVKLRGYRIELGEIESRLAEHAHVKEAAVLAREGAAGEKHLVAYVAWREDPGVDTQTLRAFLSDALPEFMVPSAFVALQSLPRTPSGKLDRRALPAPEACAYVSREYEPPRQGMEETVAGIWRELLRIDRIGREDDFFSLGGHSLLATRVMSRIRELVHVDLPLRAIFEAPTVAGLAALVAARANEQSVQQGDLARNISQQIDQMQDDAVLARIAQLEKELGYAAARK